MDAHVTVEICLSVWEELSSANGTLQVLRGALDTSREVLKKQVLDNGKKNANELLHLKCFHHSLSMCHEVSVRMFLCFPSFDRFR